MKKLHETIVHFNQFFGSSKNYYLFLIRSKYNFYRFGTLLGKLCNSPFFYIGEMNSENINGNPVFRILYTLLSERTQSELFIIENKTTVYQNKVIPVQPPTLFDNSQENTPFYYIVNKFAPTIIQAKEIDYDYLVLISNDMEFDSTELLAHFTAPTHFESKNITYLMNNSSAAKRTDSKRDFFQMLFYSSAIKVTEFYEKQKRKMLGEKTEIPIANRHSKFRPLPIEINSIYKNWCSQDDD